MCPSTSKMSDTISKDNCNNSTTATTPQPTPERRLYKPVVIVHGLMSGDVSTMEHLAGRIEDLHPGTKTYVIDRFCGLASLEPLWRQTHMLADDLLQICSLHPEGVHVIGYSQGGLIARGMLQAYSGRHNVCTFVSLSSPQGGQYGSECFSRLFPTLTARAAYQLFYTRLGQRALSVANYWYDPRHRDLYLQYSAYLAVIDRCNGSANSSNDLSHHKPQQASDKTTKVVEITKKEVEMRVNTSVALMAAGAIRLAEGHELLENSDLSVPAITADGPLADDDNCWWDDGNDFLDSEPHKPGGLDRLQWLVLIGGPDDGVISPWESSQFGVLDETGMVVPMRERTDVYASIDPIGLRKLETAGRIVEYTVPRVGHHEWHHNDLVLRECILEWLD